MKPVNRAIDLASIGAVAGIAVLAGLLLSNINESRQAAVASQQASNAAKVAASKRFSPGLSGNSDWKQLNASQQKILSPLLAEWDKLDDKNKAKWVTIANRYASLKPEEQKRIQKRMEVWAQLSPEQKQIARLHYAQAKKIEATKKTKQWELYQQLPAEKKQLLASGIPAQFASVPAPRTLADTITTASTENAATVTTEQNAASASAAADQEVSASPASQGELPIAK